MIAVWMALGCGGAGANSAGELWLSIEAEAPDGDRLTLTFPASTLREPGDPALLQTASGEIDLRLVAQTLRAGDEQVWTLDDGERAVLRHALPASGTATEVSFGVTGPKGNMGLSLSVPLQPDRLDEVQKRAQVDVDLGLPVGFDAVGCAQLQRSPPMPLVEIVGPKGNGLRIATR